MKQANSAEHDQMIKIIQNENFSVDEFKTLVALIEKNDGIAYTTRKAATYIEKAKAALSVFEASKFKDSLFDIADYTLARSL